MSSLNLTLHPHKLTRMDELDEFEAVSKAEENDYNEDGLSFQMSDETVARLGNNTLFDFQNIENANKKLSNQFYRQI